MLSAYGTMHCALHSPFVQKFHNERRWVAISFHLHDIIAMQHRQWYHSLSPLFPGNPLLGIVHALSFSYVKALILFPKQRQLNERKCFIFTTAWPNGFFLKNNIAQIIQTAGTMAVVVPVVLLLLSMRSHDAQSNSESVDFTSRAFKANISIRDFCALTQLFA